MVVFNGHYLGRNMSGYAPFRYDITDFANYGSANTVLVRVDATLSEGWFYEGAGIYRHVWLTKTDPVHVARWGTFVRSDVERPTRRSVRSPPRSRNESGRGAALPSSRRRLLMQPAMPSPPLTPSRDVCRMADAHELRAEGEVRNPPLWSLEEPNLYKLLTRSMEIGGVDGPLRDPLRHPHRPLRRRPGLLPERQAR